MSTQNKLGKLITRFEIGFDNETKADIDALKAKIDELTRTLSVKNDSHGDRLLAAMQAEAANDAPQPELKELGQWVFEGQDEKWVSAHVNGDGRAYYCSLEKSNLIAKIKHWGTQSGDVWAYTKLIGEDFDTSNWQNSAINCQSVNDVDYLSCEASKTHGMPTFIAIDEYDSLSECVPHIDDVLDQPNWLSESVPKITDADMQLIFIKNLSEVLIQRMHSMDRFSDDDYAIGGDKLMAWDIVFDQVSKFFGVVINANDNILSAFFLAAHCEMTGGGCALNFHKNSLLSRANRTITEAELPVFRTALEAYYA